MTEAPITYEEGQAARERCDWPIGQFWVKDDPDPHKPCYLCCPDGAMVAFSHHNSDGVDKERVEFIANACNAALTGELERLQSAPYSWARENAARSTSGALPLDPTPAMIEAGAQRLVRWETGNEKWPDAWSKLDVRAARNDAERCWRSMWLEATATSYFWCEKHKQAHRKGDDKRECLLVGPFSTKEQAEEFNGSVSAITERK